MLIAKAVTWLKNPRLGTLFEPLKKHSKVRRWGRLMVRDEVVISLFEISWRLNMRDAARGLF